MVETWDPWVFSDSSLESVMESPEPVRVVTSVNFEFLFLIRGEESNLRFPRNPVSRFCHRGGELEGLHNQFIPEPRILVRPHRLVPGICRRPKCGARSEQKPDTHQDAH